MPRSSSIKVTIITVCFNAAKFIEKTIQSVLTQTDANIEYIIVDGDSTDDTLAIISKYSGRINKIVSEKDAGIYDAMNKGIALATGDVIYFLNADDCFVDENVVADVARAFQENDTRMLVYGNVVLVGAPEGFDFAPAKAFQSRSITELLHNSYCHQAIFARKSLFIDVGIFNCQYKLAADYDWIVRSFKYNREGFFFLNREIAFYSYFGQSRQQDVVTRKEKKDIQFRTLLSLEFLWYYFRYVFVRGLKKDILGEIN